LVVATAASGLPNLRFSNDFRVYFSSTNPELLAFEELEATYAKSDNILFVVQPLEGDVFTPSLLGAIEKVTEEAWQLPYASRVDSITNFQHSWADGDDLTVENLVRDGTNLRPQELAARRAVALAEPALNGLLLSPDARTTGINVIFQFPEESLAAMPEAVAAARALAESLEREVPGTRVELSGVTMLNNAFNESGQQDGATLMPVMYIVLILFMVITLRSLWACLAALAVVVFSAVTALGLAGHLGIALSPIAVTAPTIIMTLAIADSIHILISMLVALQLGADKASALREAIRVNFVAVLVTTLSTTVGFLALNFSDTPPFHDLGNITALGIVAALLFSLTLLPALVTVLPIRARPQAKNTGQLSNRLDRFGAWVVHHHRSVLAGSVVITLLLISLLPLLELNDQWVRYFDQRLEFRRAADFTDEHLTGLYLVEFSIPAGAPEGINDPAYLKVLENFTTWLREQAEVRHVTSYADVVKRLNRNLHGDDPAFYKVPRERQQAAQYLLLYELSLPYGLDLGDRIAVDKSATRVTATLGGTVTTAETRALLTSATSWFEGHAPQEMHAVPSGLGVMFAHISQRNIESMLRGNVLAILLITGILMLALRSVRLGLLSLIPNTVPLLMTFGVWAVAAGQVGMAAAMVSVSSLGIVVDDTVHFLTKYLRARREGGLDRPQAIRHAFRTVGHAIVSTTAILTAGFLVLALSTFRINFELGLLTAITMILALLADFTLLPALLLWGHRAD
jgi:predicted RND superfamily exporter protein